MKAITILFVFFAYAIAKLLIINSGTAVPTIEIPTLETPDLEFIDLSDGCAGFFDCTEYLANVIYNIGQGIIYLVLLLVNLVVYLFQIIGLLITVTFTGIEGAPTWLNALLILPFAGGIGFIIYKLIRKGSSSD